MITIKCINEFPALEQRANFLQLDISGVSVSQKLYFSSGIVAGYTSTIEAFSTNTKTRRYYLLQQLPQSCRRRKNSQVLPDILNSGKFFLPNQQQSFRLANASRPIAAPFISRWVGSSMTFRAHACVNRVIIL